jgi:hypothetical protein
MHPAGFDRDMLTYDILISARVQQLLVSASQQLISAQRKKAKTVAKEVVQPGEWSDSEGEA